MTSLVFSQDSDEVSTANPSGDQTGDPCQYGDCEYDDINPLNSGLDVGNDIVFGIYKWFDDDPEGYEGIPDSLAEYLEVALQQQDVPYELDIKIRDKIDKYDAPIRAAFERVYQEKESTFVKRSRVTKDDIALLAGNVDFARFITRAKNSKNYDPKYNWRQFQKRKPVKYTPFSDSNDPKLIITTLSAERIKRTVVGLDEIGLEKTEVIEDEYPTIKWESHPQASLYTLYRSSLLCFTYIEYNDFIDRNLKNRDAINKLIDKSEDGKFIYFEIDKLFAAKDTLPELVYQEILAHADVAPDYLGLIAGTQFIDYAAIPDKNYAYYVRVITREAFEGPISDPAFASAKIDYLNFVKNLEFTKLDFLQPATIDAFGNIETGISIGRKEAD